MLKEKVDNHKSCIFKVTLSARRDTEFYHANLSDADFQQNNVPFPFWPSTCLAVPMELTKALNLKKQNTHKSYKHVSLSGFQGFLKQFDVEQASLLAGTICQDLNECAGKLSAIKTAGDKTALARFCEELDEKASAFQIDFLSHAARKFKADLQANKVDENQQDDFARHLDAVVKKLEKLVGQLALNSKKRSKKVIK